MEVQVFDGLTRTVAAVVDDSEAVLEIELLGYLRRRLEYFGDDRAVLRGYLGSTLYMLLRDNENMERSLRLEVIERENIVVLIDFFLGYLALDYFAKNTVIHFQKTSVLHCLFRRPGKTGGAMILF